MNTYYQQLNILIGQAIDATPTIKQQFYDFLKQRQHDYHHRDHFGGHITSSILLVDENMQETLLVAHKKAHKWLQPGGHWDDIREFCLDSALREAQEECFGVHYSDQKNVPIEVLLNGQALDIDVHEIQGHLHFDIAFLGKIKRESNIEVSPESHDVEWFLMDNAITHKLKYDDRVHRMIKKVIALRPELSNDDDCQPRFRINPK